MSSLTSDFAGPISLLPSNLLGHLPRLPGLVIGILLLGILGLLLAAFWGLSPPDFCCFCAALGSFRGPGWGSRSWQERYNSTSRYQQNLTRSCRSLQEAFSHLAHAQKWIASSQKQLPRRASLSFRAFFSRHFFTFFGKLTFFRVPKSCKRVAYYSNMQIVDEVRYNSI